MLTSPLVPPQLLLMLVLMLLAQGWTVRDPLISGNRRLLSIWGVYGVISVLLYVWNLVSVCLSVPGISPVLVSLRFDVGLSALAWHPPLVI